MPHRTIDVEAFVEARLPAWHGLFRSLIELRSVFGEEHRIIEFVAARIAALDVELTRVPHTVSALEALPGAQPPFSAADGRASLVARLPGEGDGPSLAFNVHLDIVSEGNSAAWTHPPFAADVDAAQRIIYGRGAMDDKAGVTIALAVLETLAGAQMPPLAGDVLFHFVLEDETTGNGSLLCLEAGPRPDVAVIIDGTRSDRAIDRHAGQLQFTIRVHGKPASVAVSHLGVNAADLLARLVPRLADAVAGLNATRSGVWTRFPSPFQFVTQRLSAEGVQLTVPDYAEAVCYMTFPDPWTLERARQFLRTEIGTFAREHELTSDPEVDFDRFHAEPVVSDAGLLAPVLRASAAAVGVGAIDIGPSTGTSDMRHFVAAGVPCLLYGPGAGFNPHRADEHYYLDDLPRMIRLFVQLASRWCGPIPRTA